MARKEFLKFFLGNLIPVNYMNLINIPSLFYLYYPIEFIVSEFQLLTKGENSQRVTVRDPKSYYS